MTKDGGANTPSTLLPAAPKLEHALPFFSAESGYRSHVEVSNRLYVLQCKTRHDNLRHNEIQYG